MKGEADSKNNSKKEESITKIEKDIIFKSGSVLIKNLLTVEGTAFHVQEDGILPFNAWATAQIWENHNAIYNEVKVIGNLYVFHSADLIIEGVSEFYNSDIIGTCKAIACMPNTPSLMSRVHRYIWESIFKGIMRFPPSDVNDILYEYVW